MTTQNHGDHGGIGFQEESLCNSETQQKQRIKIQWPENHLGKAIYDRSKSKDLFFSKTNKYS